MANEQSENGDVQPQGSDPEMSMMSLTGAAESLGAMALPDEGQADADADEATPVADDADETVTDEDADEDADESGDEESDGDDAEESDEDAEDGEQSHRSPRAEKRIQKLTAENKAALAKADKAEARVQELEYIAAVNVGLHPDYVSKDEAIVIDEVKTLESRQKVLMRNWDGIDSDDPKDVKSAAEVREEWSDVQSRLEVIRPKANTLYQERLQQMIRDMGEGRKLRQEREAAAGMKKAPASSSKKKRPAPGVPKGSAAGTSEIKRGKPGAAPSAERFNAAGGTMDAAAAELEKLAGV